MFWSKQIREAAERVTKSQAQMEQMLKDAMVSVYRRMVEKGVILKRHPGVARFTLERIRPALRAELDRRIMASASLIKLNKEAAIDQTLRRFAGWSTSIPVGGSAEPDKRKAKADIKKSLSQYPFEVRRVLVDQGHKLSSSLSTIVAEGGGALAGIWHSHFRQANYNYREEHKERDGLVYLVRASWALEEGLIKKGEAGYTDDVTQPAEEPFCRCYYSWIYNLRDIPKDMLTRKGADALAAAKAKVAGIS